MKTKQSAGYMKLWYATVMKLSPNFNHIKHETEYNKEAGRAVDRRITKLVTALHLKGMTVTVSSEGEDELYQDFERLSTGLANPHCAYVGFTNPSDAFDFLKVISFIKDGQEWQDIPVMETRCGIGANEGAMQHVVKFRPNIILDLLRYYRPM